MRGRYELRAELGRGAMGRVTPPPAAPGAAPTLTVPAPPPRRAGPTWPTVVLALGLATLVAATALVVVLDPLGDDGTALRPDPGTSAPLRADTDDEYQHVLDQEDAALSSGRLPDYSRVGVHDTTADSGYHSVAEGQLTWNRGDQVRHVLAVNIAVSPGTHCTLAWAAPAGQWDSQDTARTAAVESFLPPA